jgi:hypothetical protein
VLDDDGWEHIVTRHPERLGSWPSVLAAIATPTTESPTRDPVERASGAEGSAPVRGWWWS